MSLIRFVLMVKAYFITCCLDSVRRRISRHRSLWLAPKNARRKDPNVSRSQSLSSTKIWRTIVRLLRTKRPHSPCSGPFVLLGPSGSLRNGLCAVCKLQKFLISYPPGQAHNQRAIDALSLRGSPSCCISDTYRPLSYVEIEGLARDAVE